MHPFTVVFLVALAAMVLTRLWLARRQAAYVAAHRERVPAEFAETITLSSHQKAADYTVAKTRLGMLETAVGALVLLAFTLGGGLQALWDLAAHVADAGGIVHGLLFVTAITLVSGAVDLPFTLYRTFVIEARFGFNRMTLPLFIADLLKGAAIGAVLGLPLLAAVLWLMDRMGSWWWLYVWLTWVSFNLLVLVLYPTLIAPLFNRFSPLQDESLRGRIEALLAKCGFRAKGLFVMDGSRRSSHGNAYFTGLGASKRIVFFDTLLTRLAPAEVEAVLAHELGHFRRRHVLKRIVWLFAASLAFLALLGYLIDQPWFYAALGVERTGTAMALALFFLVIPVFTFLLHPVGTLYSRKHEYEADAYAAEHASAADLIRALVKLYQDNAATLTPDPLHSAFYDSHPPASLRVARLQTLAR
jgi:STE24 endopeptidase